MSKKVLLIAGGGTLGTYVYTELLKKDVCVDIICMEDKFSDDVRLTFYKAVATEEYLKDFLSERHYDAIVNFLHYTDAQDFKNIYPVFKSSCDQYVFLSSYRVYADSKEPITEDSPRLYNTVFEKDYTEVDTYSIPNSLIEDFLNNECKGDGWTIVRPVISFSSRRLDLLLYSGRSLVRPALLGESVKLPSHVKDLYAGIDWAGNTGKIIANLLFKDDAIGEAFTIFSGQKMTWKDVADAYSNAIGLKVEWISEEEFYETQFKNYIPEHKMMWKYDRAYNRNIDASKVLKVTGLKKEDFSSVEDGIRKEFKIILDNRIKIAQIGINLNSHGEDIFSTLKRFPDLYDIRGYAIVEDERETCAHKLSVFEGYNELTLDEILNDDSIKAVTVETDEIHLLKYALMAAKHNKHIHMEKPGSQDLDTFREIVQLMNKNNKIFHMGYMYRYNPFISDAVNKAKSGELGEIFSVEAEMSRRDSDEVLKWLGNFKGGMMFYLGCHLIDLVMQIQGEPEDISVFNCSTNPDTINTEDYGMAVLKYKNGVSVIRTSASEIEGFSRRRLFINGKKGCLEVKPIEVPVKDKLYNFYSEKHENIVGKGSINERSKDFHRYHQMIYKFAKMVSGEIKNPYTYDYEIKLFETILKCCGIGTQTE